MFDVAIIDYKMSNIFSVQSACSKVGLSSVITSDKNQILDSKAAILPGVGAFGEAMSQLSKYKLDDTIHTFIGTKKPFIGICLGLQLLFESSQEFGHHSGLGLINGKVVKFNKITIDSVKYPVPQIGWNKIRNEGNWDKTLLSKNRNNDFMYFVHSYYVKPQDKDIILSSTYYGDQKYCSSIIKENIFATQFHPEKSGLVGLKVYKNLKEKIQGSSL